MTNPYIPKKFRILRVFNETHDTATFRFDMKKKHMPGQFIEVSVFGIGECPISICSYSKDYVDLCIRNVGNVTNAIHSKKAGDSLMLRGPYGKGYPMQEMFTRDIYIIGGGTGTAPLRSVMEYIAKNRKLFGKVHVYLGFRFPHDIVFKRDFKRWEREFDFNVTVDRKEKAWKGNVGVVTTLLEDAELSNKASVLICGPPVMIRSAMEAMEKKGIEDENVYISFERLMSCGIGKCGHCELGGKYVCKHGPVFRYNKAKNMRD